MGRRENRVRQRDGGGWGGKYADFANILEELDPWIW